MAIWDDVLTERDKRIYQKAGFGQRIGFGAKPALLIIDVTYTFVGDKPEPVLKSMERFPMSCGKDGWKAVNNIASLLALAREKKVPIVYATIANKALSKLPYAWCGRIGATSRTLVTQEYDEIVKEVTPTENDFIVYKIAPSMFFGTHVLSILVPLEVDTLICCGGTTSGCLRATVVDAATYGFKVIVPEECAFDRGEVSHKINLFDMNSKYATVVSVAEVMKYLRKL